MKETKNQLFIHPTDSCGLNCEFCVYADNRKKGKDFPHLDIEKGNAKISLQNLMKGSQHVCFSGGGEPLLNTNMICEAMELLDKKKFMITTGIGKSLEELEKDFEKINDACKKHNSYCVIRISIDSWHDKNNFDEKLEQIMKWFIDKRWENCRTLFFRTSMIERKLFYKKMRKIMFKNRWIPIKKDINPITSMMFLKKKMFMTLFRPMIYPFQYGGKDEYDTLSYIDLMLKIDSEEIYLGKPRSCRGCKGCNMWKADMNNGLDITVNAKGDITLYGAEISVLANIYDDVVTYDLLYERMKKYPEYEILHSVGIRRVMEEFLNDEFLGEKTREISYPFAVIRELMKKYPEEVLNVIRKIK